MRKLTWLLGLLAIAGCSSASSEEPSPDMVRGEIGVRVNDQNNLYPTNRVEQRPVITEYKGKDATYWAEVMTDRNPAVRHEAMSALSQMGEDGSAFLIQGLSHNSVDVRVESLKNIYRGSLVGHQKETLPVLMRMLHDRDPRLRYHAASRMCWFGAAAKIALRDLQALAIRDSDSNVRVAARRSMTVINFYLTGEPPSHGSTHQ